MFQEGRWWPAVKAELLVGGRYGKSAVWRCVAIRWHALDQMEEECTMYSYNLCGVIRMSRWSSGLRRTILWVFWSTDMSVVSNLTSDIPFLFLGVGVRGNYVDPFHCCWSVAMWPASAVCGAARIVTLSGTFIVRDVRNYCSIRCARIRAQCCASGDLDEWLGALRLVDWFVPELCVIINDRIYSFNTMTLCSKKCNGAIAFACAFHRPAVP